MKSLFIKKQPGVLSLLAILGLQLSLAESIFAASTDDYPEWLEKIPGQPNGEDPDADGVPTFLEYALGAEPEAAVNPHENGSSPVFRRTDDKTVVLLPFPGNRDLAYYLEGKADLNDPDWTILARKLGNAIWQPVAEDFQIEETATEVSLSFEEWPETTFLRLRAAGEERTLLRKALAARFLKQATFGPTMEDIDALAESDLDFEGWIEDQIALEPSSHLDRYYQYPLTNYIYPETSEIFGGRALVKTAVWWDISLTAPDQFRQRAAWALSQIYVVGESGSKKSGYPLQWVNWYDILVRNSFGNFRDLLQEVTLSPKMGDYLTYVGNKKANGKQLPDENYAREVMQLFTVGLWHLNTDGTLKLDEKGEPIPTYDNYHITELAKVFTGLIRQANKSQYNRPNRFDPMRVNNFQHDKTAKEMLDGTIIPAGRNTLIDISHALDVLFNHPNTAPFISFRLIQRMTCSNPSPNYVRRVAEIFIDNGKGVRGDLGAVFKAILLDPEARDAGYMIENRRGKLREPILKFTQLCRALKLQGNSVNKNIFWIKPFDDDFGQSPYRYPSVFNFYYTDYVPHGEIKDADLVAPEFQILDDSTGMKTFRIFSTLINNGLANLIANGANPRPQLNFTEEIAIAGDVPALIDRLDLLLCHNTLSDSTRSIVTEAVEAIPSLFTEARVKRAVLLISVSPEFAILE